MMVTNQKIPGSKADDNVMITLLFDLSVSTSKHKILFSLFCPMI